MPYNAWNVSYKTICFVEEKLRGHSKVHHFDRTKDILFRIKPVAGETINMLLVNEYTLGLDAVLRAQAQFPEADYIVTSGWCPSYTREAKQFGRANNLGVFTLSEFLGALN